MPYREKIAWLSLLAMALTFTPYFVITAGEHPASEALPNLRQLWLYGIAAVARVAILGIGWLALRLGAREDARMPMDERDRAIAGRAATWGYGVLMAGMILTGVVMPFTSNGWTIVNAALAMIVAAEVVRYGAVVLSYRRHA
ncbi:MAG: hypothetical protein JSR45_07660 [Proteobacteria bacterium]|nr:hypothetical protein [Pseudomonadota bacterium]